MSAAKHTKGPWRVIAPRIGAAITIYGADREFPVATTCSNTSPATMQAHRDGTVIANARLIAAAPELLEALQRICKAEFDYGAWPSKDEISAVISKAIGSTVTKEAP